MSVKGSPNTTQVTIVSVNPTQEGTPVITTRPPFVFIVVPMIPPGEKLTGRVHQVVFRWVESTAGNAGPVGVANFIQSDIEVTGGILTRLEGVDDDSEYIGYITVPNNTEGTCNITVKANSARRSGTQILGPATQATGSFEYDTRIKTCVIEGVSASEMYEIEYDIISNPILNNVFKTPVDVTNVGGAFNGVFGLVEHGDYIYYVVQVEKNRQVVDGMGVALTGTQDALVDNASQAGAALISVNIVTKSHTIVKKWSNITLAGSSLVIDEDNDILYFIEGNLYAYSEHAHFRNLIRLATPINNRYARVENSVEWKSEIGRVFELNLTSYEQNSAEEPESIGINRRSATTEDNPNDEEVDYYYGVHGSIITPMLIVDGVLHMVTGYGDDVEAIEDIRELPVDAYGNWHWIRYGRKLNKRIYELITNNKSIYQVLRELSIVLNCVIGFDGETLFVKPRDVAMGQLSAGIMADDDTFDSGGDMRFPVNILNRNAEPNSNYMVVGDEIIERVDNGSLINLKRGLFRTTASSHEINTEVYYFDHYISMENKVLDRPILEMDISNDYRQLYTKIKANYGENKSVEVPEGIDTDYIRNYGLKTFPLDLSILSNNQRAWAKLIASHYLIQLREPRKIIEMTLKINRATLKLKANDTLFVSQKDEVFIFDVCKVLESTKDLSNQTIRVKAVSVKSFDITD